MESAIEAMSIKYGSSFERIEPKTKLLMSSAINFFLLYKEYDMEGILEFIYPDCQIPQDVCDSLTSLETVDFGSLIELNIAMLQQVRASRFWALTHQSRHADFSLESDLQSQLQEAIEIFE